ncbi:hypothetical protein [Dietzia maris]|uniref:hypothetical protein n=1 Tax=Dietzia maris TaxID=37915 RepID=UPI00223B05B7|nr:hypothetical protein [Dietzia maris]MCT1433978.1 hypothetical protein [Dietzia maris]MCT1521614.1 hypothetical protein [Dietzia maris]
MRRRWKRFVFTPLILGTMLLNPDLTMRAAVWIGQERAQRMMRIVTDAVSSVTP